MTYYQIYNSHCDRFTEINSSGSVNGWESFNKNLLMSAIFLI